VLPEAGQGDVQDVQGDREEFDKLARGLASVRRENYRTKGTYY